MEVAGGPGDRRSGHRKMAGREESPDTVLSHVRNKGNAPGNARGALWVTQASAGAVRIAHGKCHRKCTAGDAQHGGIAQENLRDVFESLASFGKGEKVG